MLYSAIVCPECGESDLISFNGLTKDRKRLRFACYSCRGFFEVEDEGGYLPMKSIFLREKYPQREGLSYD